MKYSIITKNDMFKVMQLLGEHETYHSYLIELQMSNLFGLLYMDLNGLQKSYL